MIIPALRTWLLNIKATSELIESIIKSVVRCNDSTADFLSLSAHRWVSTFQGRILAAKTNHFPLFERFSSSGAPLQAGITT